ncbi:MAG: hypothetical protein HQK55_11900 [Deltaproteobacteria bacterium]|nr:hypothetical protein [Deltaproteobacteria bacterium]
MTKEVVRINPRPSAWVLLIVGIFILSQVLYFHDADSGNPVYYETTIKGIIEANCARCHGGPVRNLMDYDAVKVYVDNGLLSAMVQGPMAQFAGNDSSTILDWIDKGAPEGKSSATTAGFRAAAGSGAPADSPNNITYNQTVKFLIAKECARCHSGPFRNLTTYKAVKQYVDNGLLEILMRPGGQMHRFAGPDSRYFLAWIEQGAPR